MCGTCTEWPLCGLVSTFMSRTWDRCDRSHFWCVLWWISCAFYSSTGQMWSLSLVTRVLIDFSWHGSCWKAVVCHSASVQIDDQTFLMLLKGIIWNVSLEVDDRVFMTFTDCKACLAKKRLFSFHESFVVSLALHSSSILSFRSYASFILFLVTY